MKTLISHIGETAAAPGWGQSAGDSGREERHLAKAVGLMQFGANHLTLQPGALSSSRHWHEEEDEFAFVLAGTVTVRDENGEHEIGPGAFVGFPAGAPNGHQLINLSDAPVEVLVVGTRKVGEERIHYPDRPDLSLVSVVRDERGERVA